MKTGIYSPSFFLFHDDILLKIEGKTIVGRAEGHIILEDDKLLSNIHCEFSPTLLSLSVKDLNSTNGVYVNKTKIIPGVEFQLRPGDLIRFGSSEYKLFDNESEAKKMLPKRERRKNPRPDNLYGIKNIINFYSASYPYRAIYFIVILAVIASFLLNLTVEVAVPKELEFLKEFYNKNIILHGMKMVFWAWAVSFLHSFIMVLYVNRNALRQALGLAGYGLLLFVTVDFNDGPLWGIKNYLNERTEIQDLRPEEKEKAILHLKSVLKHEEKLRKAYKFTRKKISTEEKKILSADYKKLLSKMDKEKASLTQKPRRRD